MTYFTFISVVRNYVVIAVGSGKQFNVFSREDTFIAGFYIGTLPLVVRAASGVVGQDGNIPPWGRVPIGIVVPLFWALVTTPVAILILSGKTSILSVDVLKNKSRLKF